MPIVYRTFTEARTWHIVFDKPRSRTFRWYHFLTGKRFAHVWAFTDAGAGVMRIEPLAWGICALYEPQNVNTMLHDFAQGDNCTALLSVTVDYRTADDCLRGPYNCVSVIKALLAMRKSRFTFTPFQLYKELLKHEGCAIVKPFIPYLRG